MDIDQFLKGRRSEVLRIAAQHDARNVRVFGSVARGEAGPTSDLDLLVEAGPNHSPWFPAGLAAELEELLGRHVDVVTEKALHRIIRDRVLNEAILL